MTLKQAIKILTAHNKWRRSVKGKIGNPVDLGIAIDLILDAMNNLVKPIKK